mmetsp:Transcript_50318/g.119681  ORF Transcript_50318/g.119681 Transcript_50318/m.119681 type:complete len:260 (+) Transcript_50318:136-915(+)
MSTSSTARAETLSRRSPRFTSVTRTGMVRPHTRSSSVTRVFCPFLLGSPMVWRKASTSQPTSMNAPKFVIRVTRPSRNISSSTSWNASSVILRAPPSSGAPWSTPNAGSTSASPSFEDSASTYFTHARTACPGRSMSVAAYTNSVDRSLTCANPSRSAPTSMNAPKSTTLRTSPAISCPVVMVERGYVTFLFQGGGAQPEPSSGSGCPAAWFNLVGVAATIQRRALDVPQGTFVAPRSEPGARGIGAAMKAGAAWDVRG